MSYKCQHIKATEESKICGTIYIATYAEHNYKIRKTTMQAKVMRLNMAISRAAIRKQGLKELS